MNDRATQTDQLSSTLYWLSIGGCGFLVIAVGIGLVVPLISWPTLPEKITVAKLTFVSIGLIFSFYQLLLGLLLALLGVRTPYEIAAGGRSMTVKIVAASPAIVLIICSNILFGFCVMREFEAVEMKQESPGPTVNEGRDDTIRDLNGKGPR